MDDKDEFLASGGSAAGGSGEKFHTLQPNRDLRSNWEVDLALKLEEYLLKICSSEIAGDVNFAEAALLLQGSIQVYSRKVEYLHSLVLHALEFLTQKREEQQEKALKRVDGIESSPVGDEGDEQFLGLDDVPVDAKNCLEKGLSKDNTAHSMKRPANILVLEGDCLEKCGDANELGSYLLSTCNFYGDFLLLDACDAEEVNNYLNANDLGKDHAAYRSGSLVRSRSRSRILSPSGRSRGSNRKSNLGKEPNVDLNSLLDHEYADKIGNEQLHSGPHAGEDIPSDYAWYGDEHDVGFAGTSDDSDSDEDPWKPLNPHEPGNLKVKPFRKGKFFGRRTTYYNKDKNMASLFPVAKLEGTINPKFLKAWEAHCLEKERTCSSHSLYGEQRRSLLFEEHDKTGVGGFGDDNNDDGVDIEHMDFEQYEFDLSNDADCVGDESRKEDNATGFDEGISQETLNPNSSLEDLCRSHLDALLASIAETEKQTAIAARVSEWKQRIECTLNEQERDLPFDIHLYGEEILEKLSVEEAESGSGGISFAFVTSGRPKREVARTFSALLHLVNSADVELQRPRSRSSDLVCYTAAHPFRVKLLQKGRKEEVRITRSGKKRVKSPARKGCSNSESLEAEASMLASSPRRSGGGGFPITLRKGSTIRCTPEGKRRRRRARLVEPVNLQPTG